LDEQKFQEKIRMPVFLYQPGANNDMSAIEWWRSDGCCMAWQFLYYNSRLPGNIAFMEKHLIRN